ncbi:VirB8/TrbF family protein [Shinella yambaruensis]|uniref:Conjugal transfer protein TrbF n=1 Tax=Shinella yambaruensis TaxID=415996 RepID=A0ABQ5ZTU1_9HYPH|nr:VirB8/TrbF family protein [Shinella yambaruensis]MCJ8029972.1 VirB8/TrbF family protein [Shinella yambaruensis]MCU7984230.1 VirB8/TrbF family protein [Shinella yambaruensis]GLR55171.1 conjugal transfer protein TrbF [Shinella yambaruensis]
MKKRKEETPEKSGLPDSPYLSARREWNERYGGFIKAKNNWRLVALGAVACSALAIGGLIAVSLQTKVVPYAVELNGHGEVVRVQRADVIARPTSNQVRASLRSWLIGARSVYTDRDALKHMIDTTYAMTLPESPAYQELATFHRSNNPYRRAHKGETVGIDVHVVVPVSDDTWQIEWTETAKNASGKVVETKNWQGNFTILVSPPQDAQQIMVNPMGIYVRQFAWTNRLQIQ